MRPGEPEGDHVNVSANCFPTLNHNPGYGSNDGTSCATALAGEPAGFED
jgi:hypothetical protein